MRNKCVWKLLCCLLLMTAATLACVPAAAPQRADVKDDMLMWNLPARPAFRAMTEPDSGAVVPTARTVNLANPTLLPDIAAMTPQELEGLML